MNICQRPKDKKMPILLGKIGDKTVITLRDTGCSGAVVKKKFVKENQYTGKDGYMLLADNSLRKDFAKAATFVKKQSIKENCLLHH